MKIDVLIGVEMETVELFGLDRTTPWLAGAISHDMLECLPYEDEDALWREMKQKVAAEPDLYTWRQITVDLPDAAILEHFKGPEIRAAVEAPDA